MHKTSRAEVHRWNFVMVQLVRERRWRSRGFTTKTQARQFYEGRKLEQREGRFFPNQYQRRGQVTFEQVISDYMATSTKRSQKEDRRYAKLWTSRFTNAKLGAVTSAAIEKIRQSLLERGSLPVAPTER